MYDPTSKRLLNKPFSVSPSSSHPPTAVLKRKDFLTARLLFPPLISSKWPPSVNYIGMETVWLHKSCICN